MSSADRQDKIIWITACTASPFTNSLYTMWLSTWKLALLATLLLLPRSGQAEGNQLPTISGEQTLAAIRAIRLVVSDEVQDNCWTNSGQIKQRSRLAFEQSGVDVFEEAFWYYAHWYPMVVVSAVGFRSSGNCSVAITNQILFKATSQYGPPESSYKVEAISIAQQQTVILTSPTNVNQQALETVDEFVSKSLADRIKHRKDSVIAPIVPFWNRIGTAGVTQREFNAIIEEELSKGARKQRINED